ncbi:uncharacterized protein BCR38DRAFT_325 [Pseudomassariella vexata]|uniref:Uncharacterized protein n=1 Tax=Pseudomassariella vexata TaxID=1141098 RepID=A0A1Y2EHG9_9PEZI|nr:uncharacterized protein BCR38DRAFT_325 [Pseudomassariella vexata]ORY70887.1 hypothetical protein BCR38DRAFT_325 [Pseudomassariella vexata]
MQELYATTNLHVLVGVDCSWPLTGRRIEHDQVSPSLQNWSFELPFYYTLMAPFILSPPRPWSPPQSCFGPIAMGQRRTYPSQKSFKLGSIFGSSAGTQNIMRSEVQHMLNLSDSGTESFHSGSLLSPPIAGKITAYLYYLTYDAHILDI